MKVPIIDNRKELRTVLENALRISEEEEFQIDKKPKSFIIESNMGNMINFNTETPIHAKIFDTQDSTLKKLKLELEGQQSLVLYLDISDKRFWTIHSLDSSYLVSKAISNLVLFNPSRLDFPWFSSDSLEQIGKLGKETGFSLKFENEFLEEKDENYEEKLKHISMRFWGGQSNEVIKDLRENNNIARGIALSGLGLKYKTESGYIKENITHTGKFVVMKGDSIDSHFNLINVVKTNYSNYIYEIENKYRILHRKTDIGFKIEGGCILMEFKRGIEDLKLFADRLTNCSSPFRLWGVWDYLDDDYIKIKAIDLHTMHKVNIELTKEWMRIFLPSESCGNVITRLFTNLQRHFDSGITLRLGEK